MNATIGDTITAQARDRARLYELLANLRDFVNARPGFVSRDYSGIRDYYRDIRKVVRDAHDAHLLIAAVSMEGNGECPERLAAHVSRTLAAFASARQRLYAYGESMAVHFDACQYHPLEYRAAVCRTLARVLWDGEVERQDPSTRSGATIRAAMRKRFGRGIAARWFA